LACPPRSWLGRYLGARGVVTETRIAEGKTRDVFTIIT
jgi:hypothetical protein